MVPNEIVTLFGIFVFRVFIIWYFLLYFFSYDSYMCVSSFFLIDFFSQLCIVYCYILLSVYVMAIFISRGRMESIINSQIKVVSYFLFFPRRSQSKMCSSDYYKYNLKSIKILTLALFLLKITLLQFNKFAKKYKNGLFYTSYHFRKFSYRIQWLKTQF